MDLSTADLSKIPRDHLEHYLRQAVDHLKAIARKPPPNSRAEHAAVVDSYRAQIAHLEHEVAFYKRLADQAEFGDEDRPDFSPTTG